MLRATFWTLVVLVALPTALARAGGDKKPDQADDKGLNVKAELTKDDSFDTARKACKCKVYKFKMDEGSNWEINLKSTDFDSYLRIEDSAGKQLAEDDDGGEFPDAKLAFKAPKADTYKIIVTSFDGGMGKFHLTVEPKAPGKDTKDKKGKDKGKGNVVPVPPANAPGEKDKGKDDKALKIDGELTNNDALDTARKGSRCKTYTLKMTEGSSWEITMRSATLDSYLRIEDSAGKQVAEDDDSGGGVNMLDAQIVFKPAKTDTYKIIATTFKDGEVGKFTLTANRVNKVEPAPAPVSAPVAAHTPGEKDKGDKGDKGKDDKGLNINGELNNNDGLDKVRQGCRCKTYKLKMTEGSTWEINLRSADFDAYLRIEDSAGKQLAEDDDSGGNLDAKIVFKAPKTDTYTIIATTYANGETGKFTLTAEQKGKADGKETKEIKKLPPPPPPGALPPANAPGDKGTDKGKEKGLNVNGELTKDDPMDKARKESHCKVYEFKMKAGSQWVITMRSTQVDSFLRLEDSAGKQLAEDDDSGGFPDAKIIFKAPKDDTYKIIATTYKKGETGKFTLTVEPASDKLANLQDIKDKFDARGKELEKEFFAATTDKAKDEIRERYFELMAEYAVDLANFADANANDSAAKEAIQQATQLLGGLGRTGSPAIGKHLRTVAEKAKDKGLQAMATLALGQNLTNQSEKAYQKKDKEGAAKLATEAEGFLKKAEKAEGFVSTQAADALFLLHNLTVGKKAPEMEGEDVDGKKFKLSDFKGKVTVLYFWGSWCPPCRAMIPHEVKLAARLKDAPFAMVGINTDNDKDKAKEFLKKEGITWTQVWDGGSTRGPLSTAWKVNAFPTIYVLDAEGIIRYREVRGEAMDHAVDELLAEIKKK
jgi:thiol-disulfide isomerase/thioredoxin